MQYAAYPAMQVNGLIPGTQIPYRIIFCDRKTYAVKILPDGSVELRVPKGTTGRMIQEVLERHRDWILSGSAKQKERCLNSFADGAPVPFRGEKLILGTSPDEYGHRQEGMILLPEQDRAGFLSEFYRLSAKAYLPKRTMEWAKKLGVSCKGVRINAAKTRWGSCSSTGSINFSLRTMMLPENCIDYIIVHELCHLKQLNHSAAFWQEVERVLPDYQEREQQIKNAFVILL